MIAAFFSMLPPDFTVLAIYLDEIIAGLYQCGYIRDVIPPIKIPIHTENNACIPSYATENSSGMDLLANEELELAPGEIAAVATGIRVAIPPGYEGQVRPRSGLALKNGISIPNAPGTIDADYRGEIKVILINHGKVPVKITKGDRIAQLVICPVVRAYWDVSESLPESSRGEGGFGSTGR